MNTEPRPIDVCPRQGGAVMAAQQQHKTHWEVRNGYYYCSYCGSLASEELFAAVDRGDLLSPTDKNYKLYVNTPNIHTGRRRIVSRISGNDKAPFEGYVTLTQKDIDELREHGQYVWGEPGDLVLWGPESVTNHSKFYFQHLNEEEMRKFVDLYNENKLSLGFPGHFYVLPYFMHRVS